jgi:hypothetical protein
LVPSLVPTVADVSAATCVSIVSGVSLLLASLLSLFCWGVPTVAGVPDVANVLAVANVFVVAGESAIAVARI